MQRDRHPATDDLCRESAPLGQGRRAASIDSSQLSRRHVLAYRVHAQARTSVFEENIERSEEAGQ
jgi:hypothetical protein